MIELLKKNILSFILLFLGAVILLVVELKKEPETLFAINAQEMLTEMEDFTHVTQKQALKMQSDTNAFVFVDLRSPYDFEVNHIENAFNIPTAFLLDEENLEIFESHLASEKTVVLYGQTEREAIGPWMLLYEIGMTNTKILFGGYECYTGEMTNCYAEMARFNYAEISTQGGIKEVEVKVTKKAAPTAQAPVEEEKKEIKVEKKVKAEAEGGC